MILVDTSAWIDHFRKPDPVIVDAVTAGNLAVHEYVIAELALGSVPDRTSLISNLRAFPMLETVPAVSLLAFVDDYRLTATGIGFVDASLLVSVSKTEETRIWTRDKRLIAQADRLGLAYTA